MQFGRLLCLKGIRTALSVTSVGCGGDPLMPVITIPLLTGIMSHYNSLHQHHSHSITPTCFPIWGWTTCTLFAMSDSSQQICPLCWKDTCRFGTSNLPMTGKLSATLGAKTSDTNSQVVCMLCMCEILSWEKIWVLFRAAHSLFIHTQIRLGTTLTH